MLFRSIELAVTRPVAAVPVAAVTDASGAVKPDGVSGSPTEAQPKRATHVRIRASRLDTLMNLVGEIEIARGRLERELRRVPDEDVSSAFAAATRLLSELREQVIGARMVPVGDVFERFPRLVRETARSLGKEVDFTLDGAEIEMDRSIQIGRAHV